MIRILISLLASLCFASPAAAQARAEVGRNGERVTPWAFAELGAGQLGASALLVGAAAAGEPNVVAPLTMAGLLPAATILSTLYVAPDGITSGMAQSLNAGMLWTSAYGVLHTSHLMRDRDTSGEPFVRAFVWSLPLGAALGGLYYWGYAPTSGQVSALNSVSVITLWALTELDDGITDPAYFATVGPAVIAPVVGGLVAHLKALSRRDVLIADGVAAVSGLLWQLAPLSDTRVDKTAPIVVAAAFATAYILLPTYEINADDPGIGFALSLVPGDAIAPVAGQRQGGWGLSASWSW